VTRLSGKKALVTGGGTGIGRAISLAFAREGAKIAALGRRPEPLLAVVKEIEGLGAEGLAVVCDITRTGEIRRTVDHVEQAFGQLNVLVNNAGVLSVSTAE